MTDNSGTAVQPAPAPASVAPAGGTNTGDEPVKGNGDPKRNASPVEITIFGLYLLILSMFLFYLLLKLMPGIATDTTTPGTLNLFGTSWPKVWPETRFILLALCAGALGSFIHTATSFADFVGNQQLVKSWLWWYLLRPFIGSCLAVTLYFAIRAGLISLAQGASALNAFGVVSVSALAGMFAKQATDKLREIFENLFKATPPPRADELKTTTAAAAAAGGKK
jgi:hypothetical protein